MTDELRHKMHFLSGQISAAGFFCESSTYADLWESIQDQYEYILTQLFPNDTKSSK